jgi:hypothetical protein
MRRCTRTPAVMNWLTPPSTRTDLILGAFRNKICREFSDYHGNSLTVNELQQ